MLSGRRLELLVNHILCQLPELKLGGSHALESAIILIVDWRRDVDIHYLQYKS